MLDMGYKIYIRDSNLKRIGEITDFTKLELIPRFNDVGSFLLILPTDTTAARELIKPKYGIIVRKDGHTVFSGTVTSRNRLDSEKDTTTIGGKNDMVFLTRRLAFPETNGEFSLQDYDVRTGKAETIMKQYVDFNCGPNSLPERRILTLDEDTGLGFDITGRARFHNLLELLQSLALKGGGLGFDVVQEDNELVFRVYQPTDRTKTAYFSRLLGNLGQYEYLSEDPDSNATYVGGGGEGKERIIIKGEYNESIVKFGRIETFVDRRDTSEMDELTQSVDEELTSKQEKVSLNFTPIDTPQLSYNKDYGLGDKVSIILTQPGEVIDEETLQYFISAYQTVSADVERVRKIQEKFEVIQDVVREVKITIDSNGETINPAVGNTDTTSTVAFGIFDRMTKVEKRTSNLERR